MLEMEIISGRACSPGTPTASSRLPSTRTKGLCGGDGAAKLAIGGTARGYMRVAIVPAIQAERGWKPTGCSRTGHVWKPSDITREGLGSRCGAGEPVCRRSCACSAEPLYLKGTTY